MPLAVQVAESTRTTKATKVRIRMKKERLIVELDFGSVNRGIYSTHLHQKFSTNWFFFHLRSNLGFVFSFFPEAASGLKPKRFRPPTWVVSRKHSRENPAETKLSPESPTCAFRAFDRSTCCWPTLSYHSLFDNAKV